MQRKPATSVLVSLLPHSAMGWNIGMYCALTLLVMDAASLRTALSSLSAPRLALLAFVVGVSALFAVGASATGFFFFGNDRR